MGFSRQEYWSRVPCLPSRDLPNPGIKPIYPALCAGVCVCVCVCVRERERERGRERDRERERQRIILTKYYYIVHTILDGHKFEQAPGVGDGQGAWHAAVHGVAKSRTWLSN